MKPRNAKERELVALAGTLRPLSEKQKDFARSLFPAEALYYSRRGNNCEFYCMCCGTMVPTLGKWLIADYAVGKWKCPNCGADCEVLPQYSGGWSHNMDRKTGAVGNTPYSAPSRCTDGTEGATLPKVCTADCRRSFYSTSFTRIGLLRTVGSG